MQAFHNNVALKDFVLATVISHRETDKLVKGQYWERGKGCAVGCTLEAVRLHKGKRSRIDHAQHALYEAELGIPQILARLEDRIFERLPNEDSQRWPERFISAIAPGADLTLVWPRFALWLLSEELLPRVKQDRFPKTAASLNEVGALYREWCETGKNPDRQRWIDARDRANQARAAAYADAAPADAYAADAYAADAAYAAAAAAYAAAAAAAAAAAYAAAAAAAPADAAAWQKAYDDAVRRQADKLIELLGQAPLLQQAA